MFVWLRLVLVWSLDEKARNGNVHEPINFVVCVEIFFVFLLLSVFSLCL
jgi:hypothetical protein